MTYTISELTEMMLKEIREARENAATSQDFMIERRLIEEKYSILLANARD